LIDRSYDYEPEASVAEVAIRTRETERYPGIMRFSASPTIIVRAAMENPSNCQSNFIPDHFPSFPSCAHHIHQSDDFVI